MTNTEIISLVTSRKLFSITASLIIVLAILDLLTTRQILSYGTASSNIMETTLFVLTVLFGYGIGSLILLTYTKKTSAALRAKSHFIKVIDTAVTITQFSLLGILVFVLYNNAVNCLGYFNLCSGSSRYATSSVYAVSTIAATVVMGLISFKFFSWYRVNKRNYIVLFYGLAAAALAISIAGDAFDKLLLAQVVEEKTSAGAVPQASFIYKTFEKYHGEIEYKVVNPHITTLYVVPTPKLDLYNQIIYWTSDAPYILTWAGTALLLAYYYKRKVGKITFKFVVVISVPLILYLVGSGLIFSLPSDIPYRFYLRLLFRAGTIGSSVLFGLAFFIISRNLLATKVRDYLIISAMGIILIGIANEISALQQTYGVAAHSLVLLASYLFSIGLYCSTASVSQDNSLRQSIRKSATEVSKLVDVLGAARIEQEIEKRVLNVAKEQQSVILKQTGIEPSLTEHEMKQYLGTVLKEIKILKNIDEILQKGKNILGSSYEFFVCSRVTGLRLAYNSYFDLYKKIMNKSEKGEHKGIKFVTTIADKDSANLVKRFLDIGVQIRHVNNMPPIDFSLSDKELMATIEKVQEPEETIKSLLVSNEQAYVSHFAFIFNELWRDAIDAKERILAIEQGIEPQFVEVVNDRQKAGDILRDLAKSVKKEALLLLPNDKAMVRVDKAGVIDSLINASQKYGAVIKVICPLSATNYDVRKKISASAPNIRILDGNISPTGMIIVNSDKFFRAELRDATAEEFSEAIGFATYSNSKPSVESFRLIFELLWNEHLLNEELRETETMQKEFINIAAHELRNPIQPILGLSTILQSKEGNIEQYKDLLDIITRSARRLQRLTEDILDVAKIESQTLKLNKSEFNLKEVILNSVIDFKTQIKGEGKDDRVKLDYIFVNENEDIFVKADKGRITQVISNLLSNAIKFTEDGIITIKMIRSIDKKIATDINSQQFVLVSIEDSGKGIDAAISDKLFNKFETKSEQGIGLGLYISRKIIEAHGGRIWAENNPAGKGATFHFSLRLIN
jgi:signal transduction histidine kinase